MGTYDINGNLIGDVSTIHNRWQDKKIVFFGDSRTWYDGKAYVNTAKPEWTGKTCVGYQQQVVNLLGASVTNQGVSGETSAQICSRIRAFDFSDYDAVFLEGGVNDFIKSSSVTVGSIQPVGGSFDTSTVYGAWQSAVEYIMANYPQVKIFMDVPAIAWSDENVYPYTTANVKGEIAELYNIPCLNLYKCGGFNTVNRDYYYVDNVSTTGWRLHFNDYGNKVVGEIIAKFIDTH